MKDQQINTFYGGMQQDLANTAPQEGMYTYAGNVRIVAGENGGASSGIITNIKDTKSRLTLQHTVYTVAWLPDANGINRPVRTELGEAPCEIKGYTIIRNTLILFCYVAPELFGTVRSNYTSCIYSVDLNIFFQQKNYILELY